jgi:hypothetical protein
MNLCASVTASASSVSPALQGVREFCVDSKELASRRSDDRRLVVPRKGDYFGMQGIDECWIDMWGEESCSWNTRLRPIAEEKGLTEMSCAKAYKEDPAVFEGMRREVESTAGTYSEMKRAMKWIFNCTGRIPGKVCALAGS